MTAIISKNPRRLPPTQNKQATKRAREAWCDETHMGGGPIGLDLKPKDTALSHFRVGHRGYFRTPAGPK